MGRNKSGHNKGYFYRSNRGWYTLVDGKFVALEYENGDRMRTKNTPAAELRAAYLRANTSPALEPEPSDSVTVGEVCTAYLDQVQATGAKSTLVARRDTLFDFCFGLPARFLVREEGKPALKPTASDRIHPGYGRVPVCELKPLHVDKWLQAHPKWKGGRRTRIQALKRAFNYGVECGLIPASPLKGYKTPKVIGRTTYLTPEQETALIENANPSLGLAIKVCIRTGARPGCEFAKLTADHIRDHGERMEWVFEADESKTKNLRIVFITDPEIVAIVRKQMILFPEGPIFRNTKDDPWTRENLTEKFRRLKNKVAKQGVRFDRDTCMYSCRHTYAKRTLQGYWSGKATNIETLAKLMGNSPQVCRDHYLLWYDSYLEPVWESA